MLKKTIAIALLLSLLTGLLPLASPLMAEAATTGGAISVSPTTVTSMFNARSKDVHPRIQADRQDFDRIRSLVQTDPYIRSWYTGMHKYCVDILSTPVYDYPVASGKFLSTANETTKRITWLTMVYYITGERQFADRAVAELLNACSISAWDPDSFLGVAQMSYGVGIGYDWLYHYLTESQRKTVVKAIYENAISTQDSPPECMQWISNWGPWCNCGLAVAAAAVFENYPSQCAKIISNAISNIQLSFVYGPGGSYPEGPAYSTVGLSFTAMFCDAMVNLLGTDFSLSDTAGIRESGRFLMATNGYMSAFNFGDGESQLQNNAAMFWYASRYNMPELSLYQRENQTHNGRYDVYLSMLWYDPELVAGMDRSEPQLDYLMRNDHYESIASFRSFPGDDAMIFTAIKSGYNQTSHSDLDIGTFVMEAMGELWFMDLGKDSYSLSGYGNVAKDARWTYYRKRAEGQNTIVVNPDSTGGQVRTAKCQITDYASAYDGGHATVNMLGAYDQYGVSSIRRSLALFDNRSRVRLRDEITCTKASTIYWFAHTDANISISSDGKTATLTKNGKTLLAQIATPSEAIFTTMNAKPLSTSPNPSGQNANEGIRKLVIKLTKTTQTNITVFFTPLLNPTDGEKELPTMGVFETDGLLNRYDPSTTLTPTEEGVYEIYNAEQLCLLSDMVAGGETFAGKTVRLMQDIDLKERSFRPIGGCGSGVNFSGIFDGNGHSVKNLMIFEPSGEFVGFFGSVRNGEIRSFGIDSGIVTGSIGVGGLIGLGHNVTVTECYNRANVIAAKGFSGGLIGRLGGTCSVSNCYNNAYVDASDIIAGGIVGFLAGGTKATIQNCYHTGTLTDTAGRIGMIGYYGTGSSNPVAGITVTNCRSTVPVKSAEIESNSTLESYSGNSKLTKAQLVSAAVGLTDAFIYDCEWENDGYPVLSRQCDTVLPEDLVLHSDAELRLVAYLVNSGKEDFSGKTLTLAGDMDLRCREWIPIGGNNSTDASSKSFRGTFDGRGHSVSNLYISSGYHYVGFFGSVNGGAVQNFGVRSGSVTGGNKSAGLTGYINGTISNCYSRASVSGTSFAAGLAGMSAKSQITNSYAVATVTATGGAGGLVGYYASSGKNSSITNCYAACTLSGRSSGGLVCTVNSGVTGFTITNSYALSGPSLVSSTEGYSLSNSSSQSAANLKAKVTALGTAYTYDTNPQCNSGYPIHAASVYGMGGVSALTPDSMGIYQLNSEEDLRTLAYMVNVLGDSFIGKTLSLNTDTDLGYREWTPIGGNARDDSASYNVFSGTLEGNGHCIRNLCVVGNHKYVGLFGALGGARIRNLGIESGIVMGASRAAGLSGYIRSGTVIENCYNKANVSGDASIGGIAGMISGTDCRILNCYNAGAVSGNASYAGIAGYLSSAAKGCLIENSYHAGTCPVGIVGNTNSAATGTVNNCYSLNTAQLVAGSDTLSVTCSKVCSATELRGSTELLGSAFAEDYFTRNRMYPVLTWENGDRPTSLPKENGVYQIHTAHELHLLSYLVRKGNTFQGETIELRADIDLKNELWLPIGGLDEDKEHLFKGTFDGKGHRLYGLNAIELTLGNAALFGIVDSGRIQNLGIESGTVMGKLRCAGLCAQIRSGTVISGCYNKAQVFSTSYGGAIASMISGADCRIENCYNLAPVYGRKLSSSIAGLVGFISSSGHNSTLINCYNVGSYYGFVANVNEAVTGVKVINCHSQGSVYYFYLPNGITATDCTQIDAQTLQGYAPVLGDAFAAAPEGVNRGYPVLSWELSTEPLPDNSLKINHTLNLASDISVNFAVAKSLLEGFDMSTVYVLTEMDAYEGNAKIGTTTVKLLPVEQGSYYYFTLNGLTAVQMNDRLSSVLYGTKDGQVYYSARDEYSIATYAYGQMNKAQASPVLKTLCADLLRYGAKAQEFKGYRTDSLANSAMTEEQKAYLSTVEDLTFGNHNLVLDDLQAPTVTWTGKSLDLASKVTVKYIFDLTAYEGSPADLSLRLTYTDLWGEVQEFSLTEVQAYNSDRGLYYFAFDGMLAAELRQILSAQIYAGDTPVSATLQYSPDTYGNGKTGSLGELCKALVAYSDSAKRYFVGS